MPKKQWFELEVQDAMKQTRKECPECETTGSDKVNMVSCYNCSGSGYITEFEWHMVARVKSQGLANLICKLLNDHANAVGKGDYVRVVR